MVLRLWPQPEPSPKFIAEAEKLLQNWSIPGAVVFESGRTFIDLEDAEPLQAQFLVKSLQNAGYTVLFMKM